MSLMQWLRGGEPRTLTAEPPVAEVQAPVALEDVIENYEIVDASGGVLIVTDQLGQRKTFAELRLDHEIGSAGATAYSLALREEYNEALRGQEAIRKYIQMRNDSQVRASLRVAKSPILGARWFVEPASREQEDVDIARFVEWNLMEGMSTSWPAFLLETLYMLDYGRMTYEKVYTHVEWEGQKLVGWKKFGVRHPVEEIEWLYDPNGGPSALKITDPEGNKELEIPIEKLAVFIFDKEGGDMRGNSILRSVYKNWFYKENLYKVDAIQKERHGIGIPVIKLPPGFSANDKAAAQKLGRNLRTNEKMHVVLPPLWELEFAELRGQPVDVLESAKHHGEMIYENVLAHFLIQVGNTSENTTNEAVFTRSSRFIADIIADVFNKYCIPQLVQYNWDVTKFPNLSVRRIGETRDWRTISFAMRNFAGAAMLTPDDPTEAWVRDELDLPMLDASTARLVPTPQAGGNPPGLPRVGMPRQPLPGGSNVGPGNPGRRGEDKSGGD